MSAHWKFGNDFAIRYGGQGKIAWFAKDDLNALRGQFAPPLHPAQLVIQSVEAAAMVGMWWETRKQTTLMAAQFEERRLLWCTDLLASLAGEITSGSQLSLDVARLLERELRRTMGILLKTSRMDVPYSFVLQCQRLARALVPINRIVYSELRRARSPESNVVLPEYIPHDRLRALMPLVDARGGVIEAIRKALPFIFGGTDDPLSDWMRSAKKDPELVHIENLALELRSSEELLGALEAVPDTVREPSPEEEVAELAGVKLLASTLKIQLLPGAG